MAVVQARMGSTRLPGKVLAPIGDRPSLALLLARLGRARTVDRIVVATSDTPADDPVAGLAQGLGLDVVRGSEHDVVGRFLLALDMHPADVVVRITADCPLTDPELVDAVVSLRAATGADYASNTLVRTFPDGLDVEVLTGDVLRVVASEAGGDDEREHVTPFVYRRPERFRIVQHVGDELLGRERWTVDTREDLDTLRGIVARLEDPVSAGWRDILRVAGRNAVSESVDVLPDVSQLDVAQRRWIVLRKGSPIGDVTVRVVAGDAVAQLVLADRSAAADVPAVRRAVERALTADAQVTSLRWA